MEISKSCYHVIIKAGLQERLLCRYFQWSLKKAERAAPAPANEFWRAAKPRPDYEDRRDAFFARTRRGRRPELVPPAPQAWENDKAEDLRAAFMERRNGPEREAGPEPQAADNDSGPRFDH